MLKREVYCTFRLTANVQTEKKLIKASPSLPYNLFGDTSCIHQDVSRSTIYFSFFRLSNGFCSDFLQRTKPKLLVFNGYGFPATTSMRPPQLKGQNNKSGTEARSIQIKRWSNERGRSRVNCRQLSHNSFRQRNTIDMLHVCVCVEVSL